MDSNTFKGYTQLKSVTFQGNSLTSIDLELFNDSIRLVFSIKPINSVDKFEKKLTFPLLRYLNLVYCPSMEVHTLLATPNVTNVDLSNNQMTSFEFLDLQIPSKLTSLDLHGNRINYFKLSVTIGVIRNLYLNNNLFRSIAFYFVSSISLK